MPRLFEMIIDESCILRPEERDGKWSLKLSDVRPEGRGKYRFVLKNIPSDSIAIKVDKFRIADLCNGKSFFSDLVEGLKKRADFIIVSQGVNHRKILILELTSGRAKDDATIKFQLKGARCFLDYCDSLVDQFLPNKNLLGRTPVYYPAIRPYMKGEKQGIAFIKNSRKNTSVDKFLKVPFHVGSVDYNYLVN